MGRTALRLTSFRGCSSPPSRFRHARLLATAAMLLVLLAPALATPGLTAAQGESDWIRWSAPRTVYVAATGHSGAVPLRIGTDDREETRSK